MNFTSLSHSPLAHLTLLLLLFPSSSYHSLYADIQTVRAVSYPQLAAFACVADRIVVSSVALSGAVPRGSLLLVSLPCLTSQRSLVDMLMC